MQKKTQNVTHDISPQSCIDVEVKTFLKNGFSFNVTILLFPKLDRPLAV